MIKNFSSIFWGYLPPTKEPYPAHNKVNAFIGPSGHGKTTAWDGLRLMLGATSFESKRPFWFYVHPDSNWAILRVDFWNLPVNQQRPFEVEGYRQDEVTACCQIYKTKQDSWTKDYYLFDGEFNDLSDLHKNPKAYSQAQLTETNYLAKLKNCLGITKEFRNLMSMSPDTVRDVVNSSSNMLFNLIFDLKGTKVYKERYDQSKARLAQESINLQRAQEELTEAEQKYQEAQVKAERFAKYQSKTKEVGQTELKLRKLEYYETESQIEKNNQEIRQIKAQIQIENEKVAKQTAELTILDEKSTLAKEELGRYDELERKINSEMDTFNVQKGEMTTTLESLRVEIEQLEKIRPQDINELIQLQKVLVLDVDEAKLAHLVRAKEQKEIQERLVELSKNNIPYKTDVKEFRNVLQQNAIQYLMLADAISIKPEMKKWQEAVEAILGNNRYRIVVDEKYYLPAKKLQEQYKYGARLCLPKKGMKIFNEPKTNYPTVRSVLNVSHPEKIEGYLNHLNHIYLVDTVEEGDQLQKKGFTSITARGLLQDNDGSIHLKYHNLCCGKMAIEEEYTRTQKQYEEVSKSVQKLFNDLTKLTSDLNSLEKEINEQIKLAKLPELKEDFSTKTLAWREILNKITSAKEQREEAINRKVGLNESYTALEIEKTNATNTKNNAENEINKLTTHYTNLQNGLWSLQTTLEDACNKLRELQISAEEIEFISCDVQTSSFADAKGNRFTAKYLSDKLLALQKEQTDLHNPSVNENIVMVVKAQEGQVDKLRERLNRLEEERAEWDRECRDLLEQLKSHIKTIMREYIAEFQTLADLLKANAKGKLEEITPEPETWQLHLAIGFDDKKPSPIDGPDLSSGQKACTSLMILLAALNSQKEGNVSPIMFLDEPKARVDDDRGNEIGQLLQVTDIQYFITHQQGESLKSIDWIDHAYSCSARERDKQFANPLIFKRARRNL
ncbi:chromosome segregation protein SMC [Clostridium aminobutyricum]|uniref:Chromosome segregation protein SMC n=1 Tax=Clostridium aminobutyricum TaxID=33953 RepID=A0A939D7H2_CLOAM|nr:chromosome segregation protein SMC [Clostridium aminobutyricum]MBN7772637.1 chromosome segregation protein SMC [Clostridium aminobutyricum]